MLQAIAPPRRTLLTPPLDLGGRPTIEHQLRLVANWSPKLLRTELESVWQGLPMPDAARQVIADGPAGVRRVAAALAAYWEAVIAPDWEHMRAVIDAEIAYRARQLVLGGISAVPNDLHPRLQLDHATIRLNKTGQQNYDLAGTACCWSRRYSPARISCSTLEALACRSSATPRGLGVVWENNGASPPGDDAFSALMGKGRTAILRRTQLPATTTDLARELGLSGATVSVDLATLKRCGMVTPWRSGRRVLYQRTALASSILSAADTPTRAAMHNTRFGSVTGPSGPPGTSVP